MKKNWIIILSALALIAVFIAGRFSASPPSNMDGAPQTASGEKAEFWTCAMHPTVKQPGPGKCPICRMDLTPVYSSSGMELGSREVQLSPTAEKLAEIQVTPVERRAVAKEVRLVGKVDYDETKLATITARVPGRLDRLYVDYTGVPVKKGDHMVYMYSPDLLIAQEELIQAATIANELQRNQSSILINQAETSIASSREKLRLWGLTPEQIDEIQKSGKPSDHLTLHAPISGVVVNKHAIEGMYVETGARIYTIADLNQLWVKFDAYESDLAWLHYGQDVEFTAEAFPGKTFHGRIAFIDPMLDPKTRTVKVRVNVPNEDGQLKPEMFVRAIVRSALATDGKVMDPVLAGKWISPMHPEIVKDGPGECDICGMDLVSAESLGFAPAAPKEKQPLVIPSTAPLITGKRAVVYVAVPEKPGVYQGREINLGPRAGEHYIVESGLKEGELVVSNGAFKIDSAIQILAKPSMMSIEPHDHATAERPAPFPITRESLDRYLALQSALATDDFDQAKAAADAFEAIDKEVAPDAPTVAAGVRTLDEPSPQPHPGGASAPASREASAQPNRWGERTREPDELSAQSPSPRLPELGGAEDLASLRTAFGALSTNIIAAAQHSSPTGAPLYVMECKMAFNGKGGRWLQDQKELRNPYYGASMLTCGDIVETIEPQPATGVAPHEH